MVPDYTTTIAGIPFRASTASSVVLLLGEQGTAKSSIMEGLLRDAVRHGESVLAVDFEGELSHRLAAVAPKDYEVHRVDVDDADGYAIDFPAMWQTQTNRVAFCQRVAPLQESNPNSYFEANAQEIVLAAITILMVWAYGRFNLRDAISLAVNHPEVLHEMGLITPEAGSPFTDTGLDTKVAMEIRSTAKVRLRPWMIYAAMSSHQKRKTNPLDLVHGKKPFAIVLVMRENRRVVLEQVFPNLLDVVNFEKLSYRPTRRLHVAIDELPALAKVDSLPSVVRRARKHQLACYYSAQSADAILSRYGDKDGQDVLNRPRTKVVQRLRGKASQDFAVQTLSSREVIEDMPPRMYEGLPPETLQYQRRVWDRPNVHVSEIHWAPLASWEKDECYGWVDFGGRFEKFAAPFRYCVETPTEPPVRKKPPASWEVFLPLEKSDLVDRLGLDLDAVNRGFERRKKAEEKRKKAEEEKP